jgi:hypothetical protein
MSDNAFAKKLSAPKGVMVTAADGKVVVTWEKVKDADHYLVFHASASGLTKEQIKELNYEEIVQTKC